MSTTTGKYNPITKWDKEKEYFKSAIINKDGATWPYISTDIATENNYHAWLNKVADPMTGVARPGKEKIIDVAEDGTETERFVDKEPYQTVTVIQRERKADKTEWLVSKGYFTGFNQFGEPERLPYSFLERYQETVWNFRTTIDPGTGMMIKECLGPRPGAEIMHYTMPFTAGNVDKLWNMSNKTNVSLLVKDMSIAGDPQAVPTIEMLKEKPFDYLKNKDYMSEREKQQELERFRLYQGEDKKTRTR